MVGRSTGVRSKWASLGAAFVALVAIGAVQVGVLGRSTQVSSAKPAVQDVTTCNAETQKSIAPETVALGSSVDATLVVSVTCGAKRLPVDLIIVGDDSLSMTRADVGGGAGGRPTATRRVPPPDETPDPRATEDPGGGVGGTPGSGSNRDEPAFCANVGGGFQPTATNTPRRPPRRTATPDPQAGREIALEPAGEEDLLRDEKTFVRDLLEQPVIQRDMASDRLRIGFVSFAAQAKVKMNLTNDPSDVSSGANRMRGFDLSNPNAGLKEAAKFLNGNSSRANLGDDGRVTIVILMSDFQFCLKDLRGSELDRTTHVISVGFGRNLNRKNHRSFATHGSMVLEPGEVKAIIELYEDVLAAPKPVALTDLKAKDQVAANMTLDPASVDPVTATITGQLIEWQLPTGTMPQTLTYRVAPQEPGVWPISDSAGIEWTDSDGLKGMMDFPAALVEVIPQTATPTTVPTSTPTDTPTPLPTATATATPTATRVPSDLYLPVVFRNWPECRPEEQTIDVALVIDTSISMADPTHPGGPRKIDAALAAALEIVNLLKPSDQAAAIGFNATSHMAAQLTSDKAALAAALQTLPATQAAGTFIDTGLQAGTEELLSARHRSENKRSIILVTDGAHSGPDIQLVHNWAQTAKNAGIAVITVGLGSDIDDALLRQVASDPALFYPVPDAADLLRIYREVARIIPCP